MKRVAIEAILVCHCILWLSMVGCSGSDEPVTTPTYFDLKPHEVVELKRRALSFSDGEAAYRLHLYYEFGFAYDEALSMYWLQKAEELGNERALHDLRVRKTETENHQVNSSENNSSENTGQETTDPFK